MKIFAQHQGPPSRMWPSEPELFWHNRAKRSCNCTVPRRVERERGGRTKVSYFGKNRVRIRRFQDGAKTPEKKTLRTKREAGGCRRNATTRVSLYCPSRNKKNRGKGAGHGTLDEYDDDGDDGADGKGSLINPHHEKKESKIPVFCVTRLSRAESGAQVRRKPKKGTRQAPSTRLATGKKILRVLVVWWNSSATSIHSPPWEDPFEGRSYGFT